MDMSSSTESGVTDPPYWMRTASAVAWSYISDNLPRRNLCTFLRGLGRADQPRADGPDGLVRNNHGLDVGSRNAGQILGELDRADGLAEVRVELFLRLADAEHGDHAALDDFEDL